MINDTENIGDNEQAIIDDNDDEDFTIDGSLFQDKPMKKGMRQASLIYP
jgi:hypothetical protein